LWSGSEAYWRTWGDLGYSVRTGEPAFDHVHGKPFFDYLAEDPALAKIFNDVMTSASSDEGAAIAAAHDFSRYRRIVDIGGGHGALLAAILDHYPDPSGVLFDLPDVVKTAHGAIDRHIATGRAKKVEGDFSQAVPDGGDAYLLKWIIHDWDDESAVLILTNCRTAMAPAGKSFSSRPLSQKTRLAPTPPAWTPRCWSSPAAGNVPRTSIKTCCIALD
jgi:spermidine synthase